MFTKGQRDEQLQKLARSGLAPLFDRVETPREKDVDAYLRLVREAELNPSSTYMIGNSPRSDIIPLCAPDCTPFTYRIRIRGNSRTRKSRKRTE